MNHLIIQEEIQKCTLPFSSHEWSWDEIQISESKWMKEQLLIHHLFYQLAKEDIPFASHPHGNEVSQYLVERATQMTTRWKGYQYKYYLHLVINLRFPWYVIKSILTVNDFHELSYVWDLAVAHQSFNILHELSKRIHEFKSDLRYTNWDTSSLSYKALLS